MKRKKINFKYLLLIPAFLLGINSFAQQKQAPEKVSAKEFTKNKVEAQQQSVKSDIPLQKVEFDNAVISNSKEEATKAGRMTSSSPGNTTIEAVPAANTDTKPVVKYDRSLISNKRPANYEANKNKAPTISNTKPTKK